MKPVVSIVICTHNRAESLRQTLRALAALPVPSDLPCELLVVDNASWDSTAQVVAENTPSSLPTRYLREPTPGQARARNTGMAAAEGAIILFTDDDVLPPSDWLTGMSAPILDGRAQAVAGGIRAAPSLVRDWMEPKHREFLADTTDWDPANVTCMVGANMAFAREVLTRVPAFDPELGPGALGFWDDSLFSRQLVAAGYVLTSALDVCVEHRFDVSRLSSDSFRKRAIGEGRSHAYVAHHWDHFDVPRPARHLLRAHLSLLAYRAGRGARWPHAEGLPVWELKRLHDIAFWKQRLRERRRPRHYTRNGLVKLV